MTALLFAVFVVAPVAEPALQTMAMNVARVYLETDAAASGGTASLPSNITVASGVYEPVVRAMLRDSPTFRRQINRIGRYPALQITVERWASQGSGSESAITRMRRDRAGRIEATVQLGLFGDTIELIAHEFEHVLEQIDGVDLPAMAARAGTGVRSLAQGHFETERAIAAGRRVAHEVGGRARR